MADREAALVLPEDAGGSMEFQVFAGFPGQWLPGQPVAVRALGLSLTEAREMIRDLGLPLREAKVDQLPDDLFPLTAGIPSTANAASQPMATLPREASVFPGLNAEEAAAKQQVLDERAAGGAVPEAQRTMVPPEVAGTVVLSPTVQWPQPPVPGDPMAAVNRDVLGVPAEAVATGAAAEVAAPAPETVSEG